MALTEAQAREATWGILHHGKMVISELPDKPGGIEFGITPDATLATGKHRIMTNPDLHVALMVVVSEKETGVIDALANFDAWFEQAGKNRASA